MFFCNVRLHAVNSNRFAVHGSICRSGCDFKRLEQIGSLTDRSDAERLESGKKQIDISVVHVVRCRDLFSGTTRRPLLQQSCKKCSTLIDSHLLYRRNLLFLNPSAALKRDQNLSGRRFSTVSDKYNASIASREKSFHRWCGKSDQTH